jgi:hypothetical protein
VKQRFYIERGGDNANGEHEWNVLDRQHIPCGLYCDGGVVCSLTTREAARKECAQRNDEDTETLRAKLARHSWSTSLTRAIHEAERLRCRDGVAAFHCTGCLRAQSKDYTTLGRCPECLYLYVTTGEKRCTYNEPATLDESGRCTTLLGGQDNPFTN